MLCVCFIKINACLAISTHEWKYPHIIESTWCWGNYKLRNPSKMQPEALSQLFRCWEHNLSTYWTRLFWVQENSLRASLEVFLNELCIIYRFYGVFDALSPRGVDKWVQLFRAYRLNSKFHISSNMYFHYKIITSCTLLAISPNTKLSPLTSKLQRENKWEDVGWGTCGSNDPTFPLKFWCERGLNERGQDIASKVEEVIIL